MDIIKSNEFQSRILMFCLIMYIYIYFFFFCTDFQLNILNNVVCSINRTMIVLDCFRCYNILKKRKWLIILLIVNKNVMKYRIHMDFLFHLMNSSKNKRKTILFCFQENFILIYFFRTEESVKASVARRREQKWLDMFSRWSSFIESRFDKVKARCRKGIPPSVRGQAWYHLSAAKFRHENADRNCPTGSLFNFYLTQTPASYVLEDIGKDLARSFPDHEMFRDNECGYDKNFLRGFPVNHFFSFQDNKVYSMFSKHMLYMIQLLVIVKLKHL